MTDKYCVKCIHHSEARFQHICSRDIKSSLITGEKEYFPRLCTEERVERYKCISITTTPFFVTIDTCGVEGKYYKEKTT